MNILILLSLISSVILLFLGSWVYSLAKKETINKVFLLLCLSLSFWAFTEFMGRQADTLDTAYFWLRVSSLWPLTIGLFVHFALVFSEEKKLLANKVTYGLIYGPAAVFMVVDSATNLLSSGLTKEFWGYAAVFSENSYVFWISQVWIFAMVLLALTLCVRYGFKSTSRTKKQQAKYVSLGFSIPLFAFILTGLILPMVLQVKLPDFTITSGVGLGVLLGFAIWKFELFSLNPATAVENIISIMPDCLVLADINGKILKVNQALVNLLGYNESELMGNSVNMLFAEGLFGEQIQQELLNVGVLKNYETLWKTKKGEKRNVSFSGGLVKNKEGQIVGIIGVANDITERKKSDYALWNSEERFRQLSDNSEEWVWEVDSNGLYTYSSSIVEKLLGFKPEEVVGKKYFYDFFVADEQEELKKAAFGAFASKGSFKGFVNRNVHKNGTVLWLSTSGVPMLNEKGDLLGYRGLDIDITERRKAEEKLNATMDRLVLVNEKLGVVGGLTRHDVRNKLSTINGYAYLLKKKHADQADIIEGLGKMEQAVNDTFRIFEFAKMYEQLGAEELTPINVEAKLNEATALFSCSLPKIINNCHGLTVLADSFLRQMFYNFIDNTRKYGQKTTTIKAYCQKTDQGNLILIYEDDGVGIPLENKSNLFKEGFSTGGSTGFGLFLTKKMIDIYGWTIEENGTPGEGAKFTITIPKINPNGKENFQIT